MRSIFSTLCITFSLSEFSNSIEKASVSAPPSTRVQRNRAPSARSTGEPRAEEQGDRASREMLAARCGCKPLALSLTTSSSSSPAATAAAASRRRRRRPSNLDRSGPALAAGDFLSLFLPPSRLFPKRTKQARKHKKRREKITEPLQSKN